MEKADIVELLLNTRKVDLNAKDIFGRTAMHIAKWTKNKEIQQILLSAPTPCKAEFILQDMHMSDVESIIRAESFNIFAIDGNKSTLFERAFDRNDKEMCELLLSDPRFDINYQDERQDILPLIIRAISYRNLPLFRFLMLRDDIDLNIKYSTNDVLDYAIFAYENDIGNPVSEEILQDVLDHKQFEHIIWNTNRLQLYTLSFPNPRNCKFAFVCCSSLGISPHEFLKKASDIIEEGQYRLKVSNHEGLETLIRSIENYCKLSRSKSAK
uniref:Ankyrin repeat protein n=1 Tax=Vannella robusta TaxID=1487602 RepID=A0A7S4HM97_9EUKA